MWPVLNGVLGMFPFGVNFCCASAAFGVTIAPALAAAAPTVMPKRFRRSRRVTCSPIGCPPRVAILACGRGFSDPVRGIVELAALHHGAFRSVKASVAAGAAPG